MEILTYSFHNSKRFVAFTIIYINYWTVFTRSIPAKIVICSRKIIVTLYQYKSTRQSFQLGSCMAIFREITVSVISTVSNEMSGNFEPPTFWNGLTFYYRVKIYEQSFIALSTFLSFYHHYCFKPVNLITYISFSLKC